MLHPVELPGYESDENQNADDEQEGHGAEGGVGDQVLVEHLEAGVAVPPAQLGAFDDGEDDVLGVTAPALGRKVASPSGDSAIASSTSLRESSFAALVLGTATKAPMRQRMPRGTLMKKIQRQSL